ARRQDGRPRRPRQPDPSVARDRGRHGVPQLVPRRGVRRCERHESSSERADRCGERHESSSERADRCGERHGSSSARADRCGERRAGRRAGVNPGDRASRTRTVTAEDIERFTAMTGDRNPLHYDAELAAATRFGGIVVQGGVTTGLLNAVVAEDLPGPGSVFLHTDWSYRAPVRPGDTITATVEVLERREDKPISRLQTVITQQHGVVVVDGTALVWSEPLG